MILDFENKWKPGDTISIYFINGSQKLQSRVAEAAQVWEEYANIKLEVSDDPNSYIRIKFSGQNNDSKIGTDMLCFPKDMEIMNFAILHEGSSEEDMMKYVLHEFGHALGLVHEHFYPLSTKLDESKTKDHFMRNIGFNAADVELNLLRKYPINRLIYSEFDPNSIMIYNIPSSCTVDGKAYTQPSVLSEIDKKFIGILYPKEEIVIEKLLSETLTEFEINNPDRDKIYKFTVNPLEDKRYYINSTSDQDISLAIFRTETEGDRKEYIKYIKPEDNNEGTVGTSAAIQLEEHVIVPYPDITEYFVKIGLKNFEGTKGSIKIHSM